MYIQCTWDIHWYTTFIVFRTSSISEGPGGLVTPSKIVMTNRKVTNHYLSPCNKTILQNPEDFYTEISSAHIFSKCLVNPIKKVQTSRVDIDTRVSFCKNMSPFQARFCLGSSRLFYPPGPFSFFFFVKLCLYFNYFNISSHNIFACVNNHMIKLNIIIEMLLVLRGH